MMQDEAMIDDILRLLKRKNCFLTQKQISDGVWAETPDELQAVNKTLNHLVEVKRIEKKVMKEKVTNTIVEKPLFGIIYET